MIIVSESEGWIRRWREGRLRQFVRWLVNIIAPFRLFSCHLSCNYLESTSTSFTVRIERRRAYEIFRVLWLSYELQLLFCYLNVSLYCFLVSNKKEEEEELRMDGLFKLTLCLICITCILGTNSSSFNLIVPIGEESTNYYYYYHCKTSFDDQFHSSLNPPEADCCE